MCDNSSVDCISNGAGICCVIRCTKNKFKNTCFFLNFINLFLFLYSIGPIIEICFIVFYCHDRHHHFFGKSWFDNSRHILNIFFSFIVMILYIFVASLHSIYCNEVDTITTNISWKITGVHCYYHLFYNK